VSKKPKKSANTIALEPAAKKALDDLNRRTGIPLGRAASLCVLAHAPKIQVTEKGI